MVIDPCVNRGFNSRRLAIVVFSWYVYRKLGFFCEGNFSGHAYDIIFSFGRNGPFGGILLEPYSVDYITGNSYVCVHVGNPFGVYTFSFIYMCLYSLVSYLGFRGVIN